MPQTSQSEPAAATLSAPSAQEEITAATPDKKAEQVAKDVVLLPILIDGIFSVKNTYKNAKKQVSIAENYRDWVGLLAELYKMDMSQIINNMLRPYFTDETIMKQLKTLGKRKQRERMKMLEED
jgi:hypothetical protein